MAMGIAGPLALKALAFIAGKALIISKVALTIAGIIALKKIFSHDHHDGRKSFADSFNLFNVPPSMTDDSPASNANSPYRHYANQ